MDYKSFRMIANPYLLKKNIHSHPNSTFNIYLLQYLQFFSCLVVSKKIHLHIIKMK